MIPENHFESDRDLGGCAAPLQVVNLRFYYAARAVSRIVGTHLQVNGVGNRRALSRSRKEPEGNADLRFQLWSLTEVGKGDPL